MDYTIHLLNHWGIFSEIPNWGEARGQAIHPTLHQQNICLSWKQLREKNRKTAYTYIPIAIFNFVRNYSTLLAFANLLSPRPLTLRTKTQQYHVQHGGKYRKNTAQTLIGILPCFWSLNLAQKTRTFIPKTLNHGMSHVRLSARESFSPVAQPLREGGLVSKLMIEFLTGVGAGWRNGGRLEGTPRLASD